MTQIVAMHERVADGWDGTDDGGNPLRMTPFLGGFGAHIEGPQSFIVAGEHPETVIPPHFHMTDQFQVFVRPGITLGSSKVEPVTVHYADAYRTYGPLVAGPHGMHYVTLRARHDAGPQRMPEKRALREVRRHRYRHLELHAPPSEPPDEVRIRDLEPAHPDGLRVRMVEAPAGAHVSLSHDGPGPGSHWLLVAGELSLGDHEIEPLADCFLAAGDPPSDVTVGPSGCRLVCMTFPKEYVSGGRTS